MKPSEARLLQGGAALLPVEEAVRLSPVRDGDIRKVIEEAGIIRRLAGRRVVLWADVIALACHEHEPSGQPARPVRRLRRASR